MSSIPVAHECDVIASGILAVPLVPRLIMEASRRHRSYTLRSFDRLEHVHHNLLRSDQVEYDCSMYLGWQSDRILL
jgi:hypothetical protein